MMGRTDMLAVRGLTKRYPAFVLEDVSFTLRPGRIMGLIGKNGAGKSTTLKAILRLVAPDAGEVRILGRDFRREETACKQEMGIVLGGIDFYMYKKLAAITDVTRRFYPQWDEEAYRRYCRLFDLDESKRVNQLSSGMRVKYLIALALSHQARLLILDEPTSGLDPGERVRFRNLLSEFAHDRIVLISTHIVPDVEYIAMQNAIMKDGRIIETGTTQELVERMKGKVWGSTILARELPSCEKRLRIVNLKNEPDGRITIRYLSEEPETETAVALEPRLEDLYLWLFPQGMYPEDQAAAEKESGIKKPGKKGGSGR